MRRTTGVTRRWVGSAAIRAILFALIGWVIAEGVLYSPPLAIAAVLAAAAASLLLVPPGSWRWRIRGLLRFVPFFLWESVAGGVDVARRALHPRLPIAPGFIELPLRLPEGPALAFFLNAVSLLPGTLSVDLRGRSLLVHLLDRGSPAPERLRRLEERVAALFGLEL